jgi:23S rRNA (cytosine1962-C5)-methyltransferase
MRIANNWKDYEIIDASNGEKLERFGDIVLIRPDPQIIWDTPKKNKLWAKAHAHYQRSNKGGGQWDDLKQFKKNWTINYNDLVFNIKPTNFKHTGIFPEQAVNWDFFSQLIEKQDKEINILNLFAYTGGATLACAKAGANVCHVDASKGMVAWAKQNAQSSDLQDKPIRWIVDDCEKFVMREINRGKKYDAIIMDPPSYGRGPSGEVWQLEEKIYNLVELCSNVLNDNPLFFAINSYTTGLSPSVMEYLLGVCVAQKFGGDVSSDEIGLKVTDSGYTLPCGSTAIWENK